MEIFSNGNQYIGEYNEGKAHGQGKYVWRNSDFYDGDWVNGFREGNGKW